MGVEELAAEVARMYKEGYSIEDAINEIKILVEQMKELETTLYILKNDENLLKRSEKLEEEYEELQQAIGEYAVGLDSKEHLIEEAMDVIQVIAGVLDFLEVDMKEAIKEHNMKLKDRGWQFKKEFMKIDGEDY